MDINFSIETFKKFYEIKQGQIYAGKIFAKDGSPHKAVIFNVVNDNVFTYCITSRKKTVDYFSSIDSPTAVVELPEDIVNQLFSDSKSSWVYCGKANLQLIKKDDFYKALQSKEIERVLTLDENLFSDFIIATKHSISYSPDDLAEMGF